MLQQLQNAEYYFWNELHKSLDYLGCDTALTSNSRVFSKCYRNPNSGCKVGMAVWELNPSPTFGLSRNAVPQMHSKDKWDSGIRMLVQSMIHYSGFCNPMQFQTCLLSCCILYSFPQMCLQSIIDGNAKNLVNTLLQLKLLIRHCKRQAGRYRVLPIESLCKWY